MNSHDHDDTRFTLDAAKTAARAGDTATWVGDFLASRGSDNVVLAAALAERPHEWFGPVQLPLEKLERLAGPDRQAIGHIDASDWEYDIHRMEASIDDGWDAPPLLVELRDGRLLLQDGNHRHEALQREGRTHGWAIVYGDDAGAIERLRRRVGSD